MTVVTGHAPATLPLMVVMMIVDNDGDNDVGDDGDDGDADGPDGDDGDCRTIGFAIELLLIALRKSTWRAQSIDGQTCYRNDVVLRLC